MPNRRLVRWGAAACCLASGFAQSAVACPVSEPEPICAELESQRSPWSGAAEILPAIERARTQLESGDSRAAVDLLRSLRSIELAGETFERAQRALLVAWRAQRPDDPQLAIFESRARDGADRVAALREAVTRFPHSAAVREAFAEALEGSGDELGGRRALEAFVAEHADDVEGLHALMEYEWKADRTARAAELATRWRAHSPNDPLARFHELVARSTVDASPQLESRLAELAREPEAASLLYAACSQIRATRGSECTRIANGLADFARAQPELRLNWVRRLVWIDELDEAWRLAEFDDDPERRRRGQGEVAIHLAWAHRCQEAAALAAQAFAPEAYPGLLVARACPDHERNLATFLADLDSDTRAVRRLLLEWTPPPGYRPAIEAALRKRLERAPEDRDLWLALNNLVPASTPRAQEVQASWSRARPQDTEPLYTWAATAQGAGNWSAAARYYERIAATTEGVARKQAQYARIDMLVAGKDLESLRDLSLNSGDSGDEVAILAHATLDRLEGRLADALALVRTLDADERSWKAEQLEDELESALATDEQLLEREKVGAAGTTASWLPDAAAAAWQRGRPGLARELVKLALQEDGGSPDLWATLGVLEEELGNLEAAERALLRALELRPEIWWPRSALAALLRDQNRWWDAYEVAVAFELPEHEALEYLLQFAAEARLQGELDVADRALRFVLARHPDAVDARFEAAALSAREWGGEAARADLEELARSLEQLEDAECVATCEVLSIREQVAALLKRQELAAFEPQP